MLSDGFWACRRLCRHVQGRDARHRARPDHSGPHTRGAGLRGRGWGRDPAPRHPLHAPPDRLPGRGGPRRRHQPPRPRLTNRAGRADGRARQRPAPPGGRVSGRCRGSGRTHQPRLPDPPRLEHLPRARRLRPGRRLPRLRNPASNARTRCGPLRPDAPRQDRDAPGTGRDA